MTRLHIVRVFPFYDPATRFGGVVSQAKTVSEGLAKRGHLVRVITTDIGQGPEIPRNCWTQRGQVFVYYASTKPWHRVAPYWTPKIRMPLKVELEEADCLTLNVGLTLSSRIAGRVALRNGTPILYNSEGALCPTRLRIKALRKKLFLSMVERPLIRQAVAVQALTADDANNLFEQDAKRVQIHVIPNGVRAESSIERAPSEPKTVLFLGRLHKIKGIDLLLRGFAEFLKGGEEARLVIAGPDEDGSAAQAAKLSKQLGIEAQVEFPGHVDGEAKRALLSKASVFALTSRTEGLPMAVLEAAAAGLPCLLTEACHVPEVEEYGAGKVVGDEPRLVAEGLRDLLARDATELTNNAQRMIRERFEIESVVDRIEALLISISLGSEL